MIIRHSGSQTWENVEVRPYGSESTISLGVARQTLFEGLGQLPIEVRYFEVDPGGHSSFERHEHEHLVMVIRGSGKVLVGDEVHEIGMHDVVHVPSMTWHQFQGAVDEPLGFLCIVTIERDRPQRPDTLTGFDSGVQEFVKI